MLFVLSFREIFEVLDLMKMDMANFTIQQIRPYIQQQSVEYERKKFLEFLKTQQGTGQSFFYAMVQGQQSTSSA